MKNTLSNNQNEISKKIDFDSINDIRIKKGKAVFNRVGISLLAGVAMIVLMICSLWSTVFWLNPIKVVFGTIFIGVVFTALLTHLLTRKINKVYKKQIKEQVTDKVISSLGYDLRYVLDVELSKEAFKKSKLIDLAYSRFKSEDLFLGKLGNTEFQFSEISIEPNHNGKPPFKGLYFRFDFNINKKFVLDVVEPNIRLLDKLNSTPGLRRNTQKIDCPLLNDFYSIFTNDTTIAAILLTEQFNLNFKKKFIDCEQLFFFSIRDGQLHMVVYNEGDFFQIDYNTEIEKQIKQQISDIEFVYKTANELKSFFEPYINELSKFSFSGTESFLENSIIEPTKSRYATASLIIGIFGVLLFWSPVIGVLLGILALIFGKKGLKDQNGLIATNKGMSIAGFVLGGLVIIGGSIISILVLTDI